MVALTTIPNESKAAKTLIAKWATAEDRAQVGPYRNEARRHNFLLGRATLRALLAHVTGDDDWRICLDASGKPKVCTATGIKGPEISLSHTRGLLACAVSQADMVGVDIEYWRNRDFVALANYAFGPHERGEVAAEGISAFYRIWTLREAISKATGKGLLSAIDGCDCVASAPTFGCWVTKTWQLFYTSLRTNYSFAIASKGNATWSEESLIMTEVTTII